MAGVAMRMLALTLLTFKKVKLIFGHPVITYVPIKLVILGTFTYKAGNFRYI